MLQFDPSIGSRELPINSSLCSIALGVPSWNPCRYRFLHDAHGKNPINPFCLWIWIPFSWLLLFWILHHPAFSVKLILVAYFFLYSIRQPLLYSGPTVFNALQIRSCLQWLSEICHWLLSPSLLYLFVYGTFSACVQWLDLFSEYHHTSFPCREESGWIPTQPHTMPTLTAYLTELPTG